MSGILQIAIEGVKGKMHTISFSFCSEDLTEWHANGMKPSK
jgi:hypothetical protein